MPFLLILIISIFDHVLYRTSLAVMKLIIVESLDWFFNIVDSFIENILKYVLESPINEVEKISKTFLQVLSFYRNSKTSTTGQNVRICFQIK